MDPAGVQQPPPSADGGAAPPPQPPESPISPQNPGTVEELHRLAQGVAPMAFEGAKLLVNKGLSNHFQVSHTLSMSNSMPSGYKFGTTYVGTKFLGGNPGDPATVLMGDIDPSGNMTANIVHSPLDRLRCKMMAQIQQGKWQAVQLTGDYKADLYTASLTLGNPDLIHGTGVAVFHYLRAVTKNVSLGAEFAYQASPQLPGGHIGVLGVMGRYQTDDMALTGQISNSGSLHATFYQKCSENLQIGVEMETNLKMQESSASLAYEFDVGKGGFVLRGSVDTNYTVKSVMEKKLLPLPFTLALCSLINHKKSSFQFGCGLIIG